MEPFAKLAVGDVIERVHVYTLCSCLAAKSCPIRNCKTIFQSSYTIHIPSGNESSSCSKVLLDLATPCRTFGPDVLDKTKVLITLSDSIHMTFLKWKNSRNEIGLVDVRNGSGKKRLKCKGALVNL